MLPHVPPLRVLVVDDSVINRRSISDMLESCPDLQIVGKAADGEEALRLALALAPDVITLDLEMPRMDGFTFLRILMSKQPTAVIVVSSYSQKENVFRALELGALDFVAKPERSVEGEAAGIRAELLSKVLLARTLRRGALGARPPLDSVGDLETQPISDRMRPPHHLVAIAASTGGPSALAQVLSRLPKDTSSAFAIGQHMPEKFTRTFAERLDRRCEIRVAEARDLQALPAGTALVCPGGRCLGIERTVGGVPRARVQPPMPEDRYVPSADRLFASVAAAASSRAVGVILTGMGDDGVVGARAILDAGGLVIAESEATAIVYGMPAAAVRAGVASRSLALPEITELLRSLR